MALPDSGTNIASCFFISFSDLLAVDNPRLQAVLKVIVSGKNKVKLKELFYYIFSLYGRQKSLEGIFRCKKGFDQ